jgi:hypothetical protein
MALPERVRVKLSSEAAGAISLTPVVVEELTVGELVDHILGLTGKDAARIREILLRGTLVSGASRFRWQGWDAAAADVEEVLGTFPDAEPERPFARERCGRAALRGAHGTLEIPRAAGERKGWMRRTSFWDVAMDVAAAPGLGYAGYSYRDHADRYRRDLTGEDRARLEAAGGLLCYSSLRDQLRTAAWVAMELYVER